MKIVATIEARMTSSRLPGKVLLTVLGKPMLHYLVSRLKTVQSIDEIIIATTTNTSDDVIVEFAKSEGVLYFRGSEEDVMARVIGAGEKANADVLVEITGDCPIIDPDIIEQTIQMFLHHEASYVSNVHVRSYPDGMDTQVFKLATLKKSAEMTGDTLDHEHVTLHMRNNPEIFSKVHLIAPPSQSWPDLGLTLDEQQDFELLKSIIEYFHNKNPLFSCLDVIQLLRSNPEWVKINQSVVRKGDS